MPLRPITEYAPNDIIPSQWANDLKFNQSLLDGRTGHDPPQAGLFVASLDGGLGTWRTLQASDYKANSIPDGAMANAHVHSLDQVPLSFSAAGALGSGFFTLNQTSDAPVPATPQWLLIQDRYQNYGTDHRLQITCSLTNVNELYVRSIVNGSPGPWRRMWHSGNGSFLSSGGGVVTGNVFIQSSPGATTGYLILGGGSGPTANQYIGYDGARFQMFGAGLTVGGSITTTGQLISNGGGAIFHGGDLQCYRPGGAGNTGYLIFGNTTNNYLGFNGTDHVANGAIIIHSGNIGQQSVASAANSTQVGGRTPTSAVRTPNAIPISDGNGLLDGWVSGSGSSGGSAPHTHSGDNLVPNTVASSSQVISHAPQGTAPLVVDSTTMVTNLNVAMVGGKTADQLLSGGASPFATGMIMYFDGTPVPAGWLIVSSTYQGKFLVCAGGTFPVNTTGGGSTHGHGTLTLSHSGGAVAQGTTGSQANPVTPGTSFADAGHGHGFTQPGSHSATPGNADHLPPYVAVNMIRKT